MRRNWRGRGRSNWSNRKKDSQSVNNASCSVMASISDAGSSSSKPPANQMPIVIPINSNNNIWKLYFPIEDNPSDPEVIKHIKCVQSYIDKYRATFDLEKMNQTHSVPLDAQKMYSDEVLKAEWPTFHSDLFDKPETTLPLLEFCIHEKFNCQSKIKVRISNHQPPILIGELKLNYFGKLITIKGTVTRISCTGLVCTSMAFECSGCRNVQAIMQPQGIFTAPNVCPKCRSGNKFQPLQSSPYTVTTDSQIVIIQELQSQSSTGTIPKSIEVELLGDLVGCTRPGDFLSVTGIVQVRNETKGGDDGKKAARLLLLYIEAISVQNDKNISNPTVSFTLKDYYAIQEIHDYKNVFRLLVHSLCPAIFGHELVKAGLILGLFGGTEREDGTRSNPHILVVGDPGLGKSQLLRAALNASPRGVYACGASASGVGLTVSLGHVGKDLAMEAGALVLADKGVCCIDELDKMPAYHSNLLEAMEQQRVSVARGGVVCSLAARAAVLAAANPAHGSYNRAKTVIENLKLHPALLSRFDIVFILLDQPNEKMDAMLSEHILGLHKGSKNNRMRDSNDGSKLSKTANSPENEGDISLSDKLRLEPGEYIDVLPTVLLRKYIAYAKRYVHPKLSAAAANRLHDFYVELRQNQGVGVDGTPITTRQLEACIRLTQARARAELREEATIEDADDVISLMKHSLIDTFCDEYGNIPLSKPTQSSTKGRASKAKKFLDAISRATQQYNKDVFSRQELIQIHKAAGIAGDASDLIEMMHINSHLLLKASNVYQFIAL
ncbi:DNA helicase MCM8-like [Aricia agestis]|uniref:DNA helicase MCM8-like n=1 Tax=Aricia agestis TaxID=91739 RepID=UPI001C204386|nr:DNA helicase MCM8-like [Aricia agestis]